MRLCILKSLQKVTALLILLSSLQMSGDEISIARKAEILFQEKLYGDALPLYSSLISQASSQELKEQWTLRIARCEIEEGELHKALALLSTLDCPSLHIDIAFLKSTAYGRMNQHAQALSLLEQIPLPKTKKPENVVLHQGYHLIEMGEFDRAQKVLKSIQQLPDRPLPYELAQVLLAKIALATKRYEEALQPLAAATHPSLYPMATYLKGWALVGLQRSSEAVKSFEQLHRNGTSPSSPWGAAVLKGLITSSLSHALKCNSFDELTELFSKMTPILNELSSSLPKDSSYLLQIDFHLIKAKTLSDLTSYTKAMELIAQIQPLISEKKFKEILIKQAAAAPSYEERKRLFSELSMHFSSPSFSAEGWFLTGLNYFEEGVLQDNKSLIPSTSRFEEAANAFIHSINSNPSPEQLALSQKYLAIASLHIPSKSKALLAWETLEQLSQNASSLSDPQKKKEALVLMGWAALRLNTPEAAKKTQSKLDLACLEDKEIKKLSGLLSVQLKEWEKADFLFSTLLSEASSPSSCGEIWFWRGLCAGLQQKEELQKEYFQQAYATDPQSPYAPIAYFHSYSYRDYMLGKRKAIKHLRTMAQLFPRHPLLINAYYLMGLYHKKDLLSEEGTVLRYKDWTSAIDAFQLAETTFDSLLKSGSIPSSDRYYYLTLRYQAQLERAKANFSVGLQTTGGKRAIYLEYAEEVFKKLIKDFQDPNALAWQGLADTQGASYHKIWSDAELHLARLYEEKEEWEKAEETLAYSLSSYDRASISDGYGLMRTHALMGKLMKRKGDPLTALAHFQKAEQSAKEHLLASPREKLDLWIQQSMCYKDLNELDQSMRLLSRAINDDVISPLRIKAMLLRAEIYELQGRPELALKQLEAAACKGGEWAQQAKEKMEKTYGYILSVPHHRL